MLKQNFKFICMGMLFIFGVIFNNALAQTNPYTLLGVRPGDDPAVIKKAWRNKLREVHPDAQAGRPNPLSLEEAEEQSKIYNKAYQDIKSGKAPHPRPGASASSQAQASRAQQQAQEARRRQQEEQARKRQQEEQARRRQQEAQRQAEAQARQRRETEQQEEQIRKHREQQEQRYREEQARQERAARPRQTSGTTDLTAEEWHQRIIRDFNQLSGDEEKLLPFLRERLYPGTNPNLSKNNYLTGLNQFIVGHVGPAVTKSNNMRFVLELGQTIGKQNEISILWLNSSPSREVYTRRLISIKKIIPTEDWKIVAQSSHSGFYPSVRELNDGLRTAVAHPGGSSSGCFKENLARQAYRRTQNMGRGGRGTGFDGTF